jgi:GDP-D-mannose dehydratase
MKKIIITGVTGMDGSLMADYLLNHTDHFIIAGARR